MSRLLPAAVFAGVLAVAAAATVPLHAVADRSGAADFGLSADRVEGSIWRGRLRGARLGAAPLGDLDAGVDPLPLLAGTVRMRLRGGEAASVRRAVLVLRGGTAGVEGFDGVLPLSQAGVPGLDGTLTLQDAAARFGDGACRAASGQAEAVVRVAGLAAPPLKGDLACAADGRAELRLQGTADGLAVRAVLTLAADGGTELNTRVRPPGPDAGALLAEAGFTVSGDDWVRTDEGRLGH